MGLSWPVSSGVACGIFRLSACGIFRALWGRYLPVLGATVGGSRSTRLRAVTLGKGRVPLRFVLDHAIVGSYQ